ncbi:diguanylate cyclase [Brevibacillus borstelensis]|uniref:diguanylate cyclase n=1 Tax=Brevibacillus borstelensis TaxID=45462 RepID=UPI002E24A34D|nr:diguanylate cyclase [Brevibacillus borstelensis]MED2008339.1 diguanylate cyclase [Brevibacillus borstelensis]
MKEGLALTLKNIAILLFYAAYTLVKLFYFQILPYALHFLIDITALSMTYIVVQPTWIKTFRRLRKWVTYAITGIAMVICGLWTIEHYYLFGSQLGIELYYIPIVLATLFLSTTAGLIVTGISNLILLLVKILVGSFQADYLIEMCLNILFTGLLVYLIRTVVNLRDQVANKQHVLLQNSRDLVIGINREGIIDVCNASMLQFLGVGKADVTQQYFWEVEEKLGAEENQAVEAIFSLLYTEKTAGCRELEIVKGGKSYTFSVNTYHFKDDGFINGRILVLSDLTERKEMERELEKKATEDKLTGLHNRGYFEAKFKEEKLRSERYHHQLSLILIDLDHFKRINDQYGHLAGDAVLRETARFIRSHVRETDCTARYGGEEFVILLPETGEEEAMEVAQRIHQGLADRIICHEEKEIRVSASLGVVTSESSFDLSELLGLADKALYQSKKNGRNQITSANSLRKKEQYLEPER